MATKALPQQAGTSRTPAAETPGVTATVLQATALPASQFTALLAAIQDSERKLDGKLAEFKSDVRKAQEDATAKAIARARQDKPYEYKKKSHDEQARFNRQVEDAVSEAREAIDEEDSPAISRAKQALEKGAHLLAERQKLIKIADRSANGWNVVAEYTADELADDSEDEKRIEKAERAAEKKAGLRNKRRRFLTGRPGRFPRSGLPYAAPPPPAPYPGAQQMGAPQPGGPVVRRTAAGVAAQRPLGPCFACGDIGHLRAFCPKMHAAERKSYPSLKMYAIVHGRCKGPADAGEELIDNVQGRSKACTCKDCICSCRSSGVMAEVNTISPSPAGTQLLRSGELDGESQINFKMGWEIELPRGDEVAKVVVKGRLKASIAFWEEELKAPTPIIRTIEHGYVLPLKSEPTPYVQGNHHSAIKNSSFVQQSLAELTVSECIVQVPKLPHVCSPLSVVENKTGKKRLVINLRHLNRFLWKQKFKYEDLRVAMLLLNKGEFLFSFDLKSGYHHVDIAECHWKYLGFTWQEKFYVFTVLPFGLSTACYAFTKLLRPLVRHWRSKGLKIVVDLDDGLCAMPEKKA